MTRPTDKTSWLRQWPTSSEIGIRCALLTGCLFASLVLALYMANGGATNPLDLVSATWVVSQRSPVLDTAMLVATYLCSWPVVGLGGALAIILFMVWRHWLNSIFTAASLASNVALNSVLKILVNRARPDQVHALLPATGSSFPSGHTFSAFAFYGLIALFALTHVTSTVLRRALIATTSLFIGIVGVSRVYVGAHWPSDVLESCLLGAVLLALASLLVRRDRAVPASAAERGSVACAFVIWCLFVVGFATLHPISENLGAVGETPVTAASVHG